jgi:hypothetical protein
MRRAFVILLAGLLLVAANLPVEATPPFQAAQATITDPQPLATLRGRVNILGIASHPQFDRYELAYTREPVGNNEWVFMMDNRSPVAQPGLLGIWDTARVADGTYALRLRVIRKDGNYDERFVGQLIVANTRPTETPTPEATPTPTITPTPRAPTPTIVVDQPTLAVVTPRASPSPSATPEVGAATPGPDASGGDSGDGTLNLRNLGRSFLTGGAYAVGIFLVVGAFFTLKALIGWLWARATSRRD